MYPFIALASNTPALALLIAVPSQPICSVCSFHGDDLLLGVPSLSPQYNSTQFLAYRRRLARWAMSSPTVLREPSASSWIASLKSTRGQRFPRWGEFSSQRRKTNAPPYHDRSYSVSQVYPFSSSSIFPLRATQKCSTMIKKKKGKQRWWLGKIMAQGASLLLPVNKWRQQRTCFSRRDIKRGLK